MDCTNLESRKMREKAEVERNKITERKVLFEGRGLRAVEAAENVGSFIFF